MGGVEVGEHWTLSSFTSSEQAYKHVKVLFKTWATFQTLDYSNSLL